MSKQQHSLTYERTDDMSVLSDFYCGVTEMDDYIHNKLQAKIEKMPELESYVVREDLRETGIGESIVDWIDGKARNEHPRCKYLSVNALVDPDYGYTAVPFYEKCNFIARKSHAMAVAVRMTRIIK